MIKKIVNSIFIIRLLAGLSPLSAQLSAGFSPSIFGQTIEGLSHVQIISTWQDNLKGLVTIRVKETNAGNVLTVKTALFIIRPGVQEIDRSAFANARFTFGNNSYGATLNQTRRFPEGEYEYCFEIEISEPKIITLPPVFENCFVHQLQPMTPLLLISPIDEEETCNKRPDFTWQPPLPLPANSRFRLIATELKEKQDVTEAITYNQPIINQANIPGNMLFFPSNAPELQEGKEYAWQVTLYAGKTILKKSEIWTLKIKCKEDEKPVSTDSYRELKETDDGNFYIAGRFLRFSINNPYGPGALNYSIVSAADQSALLKKMPVLQLYTGLNKYDIDLSENKLFKNGQEYLLKVKLANNREMTLKFIYKTAEE